MMSFGPAVAEALGRLRPKWKRPRDGVRILVIGGHQAAAIGHAMANLNPDLAVVSADGAARRYGTAKQVLRERDRYDAVFVAADAPAARDLEASTDPGRPKGITLIPTVEFAAFHPDLVPVASGSGAPILGPMGASHSALVLFAYLSRLSPAETMGLFHRDVYERLGYLDAWEVSADRLRALGARAGYDLETSIARWARRGCFMHAPDRMRLHATTDLARGLLDRAGIAYYPCGLEDHLSDDPGAEGCWPVYPEIATRYGVTGSALFLPPNAHRVARRNPTLSLSGFVAASFAAYARLPEQALTCPRVAAWLGDRALSAELRTFAIRSGPRAGFPRACAATVTPSGPAA